MKEQILPPLPIVGTLKLTSKDGKTLRSIDVVKGKPSKDLDPFFQHCFDELLLFLTGKTKKIKIKLDMSELSPFHLQVLEVMKEVPYGKVRSYKDLADRMNSKAYQAIGSACGRNPFLLIYPCHRIVGSKGPGGFAHGPKMKTELLRLEGVSL